MTLCKVGKRACVRFTLWVCQYHVAPGCCHRSFRNFPHWTPSSCGFCGVFNQKQQAKEEPTIESSLSLFWYQWCNSIPKVPWIHWTHMSQHESTSRFAAWSCPPAKSLSPTSRVKGTVCRTLTQIGSQLEWLLVDLLLLLVVVLFHLRIVE